MKIVEHRRFHSFAQGVAQFVKERCFDNNPAQIHEMERPSAVSAAHTCTPQLLWLGDSRSGAMIFC